ncbi:hypothetical protein AGMMS49949_05030 [Alphaproteobacteria bacterium]|nr:hypothetical protein AGMMS49949_05030 [Alphaproteobacteria bacterium]GHS97301.1 hypothetical protein AGMMS50296_4180 [Alphaproteobacteria bacterium]
MTSPPPYSPSGPLSPFLLAKLRALVALFLADERISADRLFQDYCVRHRLGSQTRRDLSSLFYDFLRHYWPCWYIAQKDAAQQGRNSGDFFIEIFTQKIRGQKSLPAVPPWAEANMPPDLWELWVRAFGSEEDALQEAAALCTEAPLDLRVNTFAFSKSFVVRELCADGFLVDEIPHTAAGLRLSKRAPLQRHPLSKKGAFEIQDAGSQRVAHFCLLPWGAEEKEKHKKDFSLLDYCAGGGGKALAFLNELKHGTLTLTDISAVRLARAQKRFARLPGALNQVRFVSLPDLAGAFDLVVVDAPCSGLGTLRRNPDKTLRLHKEDVEDFAKKQKEILSQAAPFVKQGGFLAYITCSLLQEENEDVVEDFLLQRSAFSLAKIENEEARSHEPYLGRNRSFLKLSPYQTYTDGFFAVLLKRE